MTEFKEYLDLREQVITGNLFLLRNELIHLLYKLYIKQIRNLISLRVREKHHQGPKKIFEDLHKNEVYKLISLQKDFSDIPTYTKEIEYIIPFLINIPDMETIQKDLVACKILTKNPRTQVSQYTFEILMALTEKFHYKSVENLFFNNSNKSGSKAVPQLEVIEDLPQYT